MYNYSGILKHSGDILFLYEPIICKWKYSLCHRNKDTFFLPRLPFLYTKYANPGLQKGLNEND